MKKQRWDKGMDRIEAMRERIRRRSGGRFPVVVSEGDPAQELPLYPCLRCPFKAVSPGALEMHVKIHHEPK